MTDYDDTKPARDLRALKQRIAAMQDDFKDVDGNPIDLGYPVQYINEPEAEAEGYLNVWNPERWGIVVALTKTAAWDYETHSEIEGEFDVRVKVERPNVIRARTGPGHEWSRDEFTCDVKSVRVIQ